MSVDMYVSSSQSQASSVAAICRQQKQGYEQLQRAINEFVLSSPQLQGAAYESAKQFFSAVLTPLSKGGILLSEAVMEACQKFPEEYMATVDSGDLKESDLREKIEQMKRQMSELSHLQDRLQSMLFRQQQEGALDGAITSRMSSTHSLMATYGRAKQKLEEKLDKLLAFNASSPAIFAEISALENAVSTGAEVASVSWNSSTGIFSKPKLDKMDWAREITEKWTAYQKNDTKVLLKDYEVIRVVNGDGSVDWYLSKDGKWLPRTGNSKVYFALDSIQNDLKGTDYNTYSVNRNEVLILPGFGMLGYIGRIGKAGKGILDILKGLSFINDLKINFSKDKEVAEDFNDKVKDGIPTDNHNVVSDSNSLKGKGEPNSSADLLNPDGSVKQRRYYGPDGKPLEDIDFNHSDDGTHEFPHRHKWDWNKRPPRQKGEW